MNAVFFFANTRTKHTCNINGSMTKYSCDSSFKRDTTYLLNKSFTKLTLAVAITLSLILLLAMDIHVHLGPSVTNN